MRKGAASGVVAILFALALPSVGHAGLIRCDSRQITAQDFEKGKAAARRAAGASKLATSLPNICMNPGRGRLWFEAEPEPQADGSVVKRHFVCTREMGPWSCEALQTRVAHFDVMHDGASHAVEFELPPDLAMADARQLVTRAFELGPSVLDSQQCTRAPDPNVPDALPKKAFAPEDFDPTGDGDGREILAEDNGDMAVINGTNGIVFSRSPDGTWTFHCWSVWITVA